MLQLCRLTQCVLDSCHVLMGPHMENFADILQQLQCQPAVSGSLRSVSNLQELVALLETRVNVVQSSNGDAATCTSSTASEADPRIELSQKMADLAISTLALHEAWLIKWLAA